MELGLLDGAASGVAAVEVAAAVVVVHTAVEIFVVLTFAVDFDLDVRFVAAVFVDVVHAAVAAVLVLVAVGPDAVHAVHDVVAAVAVAADSASPLPWACLDFVGAAA